MANESMDVFDRAFLFLYKAGLESIGFAAEGLTVVKSAADVSEHGKEDFAEHLLKC